MKHYFPDNKPAIEYNRLYAKPNDEDPFFSYARFRSFVYAWSGIIHFFKKEQNAKVHLVAAIAVILLSIWFRINRFEIIVILFSIAFVWIAEMFNTVIEKAMDLISPEWHPKVKIIKDVSAGAVLLASIAAVITGLIIFIPKFFQI
jgi:diacylglycerol kinase